MYSVFWPVGISCRIVDVLWAIESSSGVGKERLALSGKADKASFLRDYGPPIDISVDLTAQDSEYQAKTISNESGEWYEIGNATASKTDQNDLELLDFGLSLDQKSFENCVLMAMKFWCKRTHDLMLLAEIFGIEQCGGIAPDRWPADKPFLPMTSFSLFLRPKNW